MLSGIRGPARAEGVGHHLWDLSHVQRLADDTEEAGASERGIPDGDHGARMPCSRSALS